ncbi:MAG: hypothetical protein V1818_03460 [Candidatus Aenigmatarchaeota archaeon]
MHIEKEIASYLLQKGDSVRYSEFRKRFPGSSSLDRLLFLITVGKVCVVGQSEDNVIHDKEFCLVNRLWNQYDSFREPPLDEDNAYIPHDLEEREPLLAHIEVRKKVPEQWFKF